MTTFPKCDKENRSDVGSKLYPMGMTPIPKGNRIIFLMVPKKYFVNARLVVLRPT